MAISGAIVSPTFRLLYAELIPPGEEVMWFGMQVVLSCATAWVSYVVTGPLQNATHNLRFPLILCLIFLIIPPIIEYVYLNSGIFRKDKEQSKDEATEGSATQA